MEYDDEFVVDAILAQKKINGNMYYLLQWAGCSRAFDTWVSSIYYTYL